jgi:subtilisin-like proprotein convertase family protein
MTHHSMVGEFNSWQVEVLLNYLTEYQEPKQYFDTMFRGLIRLLTCSPVNFVQN